MGFSTTTTTTSTMTTAARVILTLAALIALAAAVPITTSPIRLKPTVRLSDAEYTALYEARAKRWCSESPTLICNFIPTVNSSVRGMVLFTPEYISDSNSGGRCGVMIRARVYGLVAGKKSAMHIHTWGDITLGNGKSAGGHFTNPGLSKVSHGMPDDKTRHWGDFGSLSPSAVDNGGGLAVYERLDKKITILGIVGRGMIIHRDEDKGVEAQPSGGAGPRKAMCVIGYANPDTKLE